MIVKTEFSPDIVSEIFGLEHILEHNIVEVDEFSKLPFGNHFDVDFVISDIESILNDNCKIYSQIAENDLASRLVVLGKVKDKSKIVTLLSDGFGCYIENPLKDIEKINRLLSKRENEKKRELTIMETFADNSFVKKVRLILDKGDSRSLQKLLTSCNMIFPLNLSVLKEYYILIMKTVFEFAEEKGVRHIEKKDMLTELINKNDFESLQECAVKKITGLTHLVEVNKNNQSKMVAEYIKDYVDENYMKQETNPGNIAERFGVSGSYLGILFREQQKTTISKYITQLRISKAAELLTGTKLQIQAIAEKVGYSDQNYFARIFKKQTGLSPGEYRNKGSH